MILSAVLSRAQRERVPVRLTASPDRERLYSRMGFEMPGGFSIRVVDGDAGGIMIWYPEGPEGPRGDTTGIGNRDYI